ncbi:MAG: V-type ATP synthase subunit E [Clostridia bacterium]|nr:V-type ATP synthase subunit E [Clostridia bacterium]
MDGKEKIIARILLDAEEYGQEIKNKSQSDYDEAVARARAAADKLISDEVLQAESDRAETLRRRKVIADLDGKKVMLTAKTRGVEAVFERVVERLNNLDKSAYMSFIDQLLSQNAPQGARVVFSKNAPFSLEEAQNLSTVKAKGLSTLMGGDFSGGAMIEGKDADVNLSFDAIVSELKEGLETSVAEKLFG